MAELDDAACMSIGNPHATFFVADADAVDLARLGPELEGHGLFPERANISLAQVVSREHIVLRTNKVNRGLAQNYLDVACVGRGKYYRLICGDDAEPKETMLAVFREIGQADMIIPYYVSNEGKSLYRRSLSNVYAGIVNLISGFHLHYYNGLAVHLRYNVMRWHPNTRGFGFQADIICMLLDQGFSYKEVPVISIERRVQGSNALTFKNGLSVAHTLVDLIFRRLANWVYRRR